MCIAYMATELDNELTKQTSKSTNNTRSSSNTRPLPYSIEASNIIELAENTMFAWILELPGSSQFTMTVSGMATYLNNNIVRCARFNDIGVMLSEMKYLLEKIRDVVDLPDEVGYLGNCLYCDRAVQGNRTDDWIEHGCGATLSVVELLTQTAKDINESWVSAKELIQYVRVVQGVKLTYQQLARWTKEGRVRRFESYYHTGDVLHACKLQASKKKA